MSEKKELLNMLRVIWTSGNSSLRRIFSSWDELEANVDLISEKQTKSQFKYDLCPNCGVIQKIEKPLDNIFPYNNCKSCNQPFHVNSDLSVRKLTEAEQESMPAEGVRILEDLNKKKMAIIFKLE